MDFEFECITCGKKIIPEKINYLCPDCKEKQTSDIPPLGVLKTVYEYEGIKKKYALPSLRQSALEALQDFLPIKKISSLPKLKIGQTPIYRITALDGRKIDDAVFVKDDSQNPTYSFKDRASALVSAYASENKINTIIAASTGNAGSSLAGICAAQQQKAVIFVPANAPLAKLTQIVMYGATIIPVDGTYDDAFDMSVRMTEEYGYYNRNTAFNPFTIEGKKTVAFEIADFFGHENLPDYIFVPVGDGVIISGVYKGFEDLYKTGFITHIPVIVAVQAEGSSNIIDNLNTEVFKSKPSQTLADSISVDIPRNFYMAKDYLIKYKGKAVSVSDDEIISASALLARNTGLFAEPAAAASFAGYLKFKKSENFTKEKTSLVMLTGSGLKDLKSLNSVVKIPAPYHKDRESLRKIAEVIEK